MEEATSCLILEGSPYVYWNAENNYDVKFLEINVTTIASLPFIELPQINLMQKHLFAYLYQKHQLDCGPSAHFLSLLKLRLQITELDA